MSVKNRGMAIFILCLILSFLVLSCANKVEVRAKGEMQMGVGVGQR